MEEPVDGAGDHRPFHRRAPLWERETEPERIRGGTARRRWAPWRVDGPSKEASQTPRDRSGRYSQRPTTALERVIAALNSDEDDVAVVVLDLHRAGAVDGSTIGLLRGLPEDIRSDGQWLVVTDPAGVPVPGTFDGLDVEVDRTLDGATRRCEEDLLAGAGRAASGSVGLDLAEFTLVRHLGDDDRARLLPRFVERTPATGEVILQQGADADALHLLVSGVAGVEFADPIDGPATRFADLYSGVVIGGPGLLGEALRSATVRAATDGACFELARPELMRLCSTDHLVYTRIIEHLLVSSAERLRRANREAALLRD